MTSPELILGLVATLDADTARRDAAVAALRALPQLTLGAPHGARLPLVLETRPGDDEAFLSLLRQVAGVLFVDVVFAQTVTDIEVTDAAT